MEKTSDSVAAVLEGTAWRFDIENAPRGREVQVPGPRGSTRTVHQPDLVILAAADGQTVTVSRWLPTEGRWNMLAKNERPAAWMPYPVHPARTAARQAEKGVG